MKLIPVGSGVFGSFALFFPSWRRRTSLEWVVLLSLTDDRGEAVLTKLRDFSVSDAHCYDPNEEQRLRQVIKAVGIARFEKNIQNLAEKLSERKQSMLTELLSSSGKMRSPRSVKRTGNWDIIYWIQK